MGSIGKFLGRLFGRAAGRSGLETQPVGGRPRVSGVDSGGPSEERPQARGLGVAGSSPVGPLAAPVPREPRLLGPWPVGKMVGSIYRISGVLGRGGMGIVYLADDLATHRKVAVKVPLGRFVDDPVARKQFTREAEAWTELVHPHIVHAFDVRDDQTTDYRPVIVMDYCDGGSLHDRIHGRGGLSLPDALDIAIQVCWGMEFAHERGYIHRDLKPSNVLLTSDGKALVTDLGLSKRVEAQDVGIAAGKPTAADAKLLATLSQSGGTPEYMAPEQWAGQAAKQSDIYAFGVMLYEVLCGRLPFSAEDRLALRIPHESAPPPDPRQINSRIPAALAELILACMAKRPKERPDFGTLADRLAEIHRAVAGRVCGSRHHKPTQQEVPRADQQARAWALIRLGHGCRLRGDLDDALRHWRQAEATCRELGYKAGLQASLGNHAVILQDRGDLDEAMKLLKEQERLCRELCDKAGMSKCLGNQGLNLQDRGDLDGAMKLYKAQERICRRWDYKPGLIPCLGNQAGILQHRGDQDGAMKLLKEQECLGRELGSAEALAYSLACQALLLGGRQGRHRDAVPLAEEAYRLATRYGLNTLAQGAQSILDQIQASQR